MTSTIDQLRAQAYQLALRGVHELQPVAGGGGGGAQRRPYSRDAAIAAG